jgi:hypothetical protein
MTHGSSDTSKDGTTDGTSGAYRVTTRIHRDISQCSQNGTTACNLHQQLVADLDFSVGGLTHLL